MAGNKTFTELTELETVDKSADWMAVVDVSDKSASDYGTTKKALVDQFIGEKGDAATVDVGTTTTGAAGTDASVVNVGTTSAAVFNFTIPRGNTGATGAAGSDGADGDSAYVYIAYASDASGTGFTTTFNAALDYIAVKATTTEITTPQASDFTGLWKNYKGIQGIQGEQGVAGEDGSSAYVYIAYASDANGTGFTTTFDASLDYIAIKATTSPIASPQASDFTGLWKNYKGEKGDKGDTGSPGADGEDGLDITWKGTYSSGTAYVVNDAVFYEGSSYICILNSTGNLPTNTTYWNLMAQEGAAGSGSGDVSGPSSSTDNAIARFDSTTGKLIQNSLVTIDDSGSVNIPTGQNYLVNGVPVSGYSDEQAQDAVGSILTDSSEIDFTYTDATPSITASIKAGSIDETKLDTSVNASLDLADSAIQSEDLATVATTGSYSDLSGTPDLTTKLDKATNVTAINDTGIADGEIAVFNLTNKDIRTSDKTLPSGAVVGTTDTQALSNKTLTSPVINTGVSGTAVLDEDDMASNSATQLATQQSIKAYVDAKGFTWKGPWATSTPYDLNDTVENDGSGYVCTSAHTSGATTEPGVGASWADKWDLFVEGLPEPNLTTATTTNLTGVITGNGSVLASKTNPTGDFVGTTDTQTLTNKTLTAPALSSPTISGAWDGWISAGETWTYASADDPTFTFTVNADVTTKYSAGMKIKLTQGTVKYFIITAVSTYSGGNTTITVYGGTDYDLANSAISANAYSMMRTPAGFPMSPSKWSILVTDTTNRSIDTVYRTYTAVDTTNSKIDIPIGEWYLNFSYNAYIASGSGYSALSTSTSSVSNPVFRIYLFPAGAMLSNTISNYPLTLAAKTTYYILYWDSQGSKTFHVWNQVQAMYLQATCAYL